MSTDGLESVVARRQRPVRTCVGCRTRALSTELLRVVVEDGGVVPDAGHRRHGRGAWIHPDQACLRRAERRRAFPRALRVPGSLDVTRLAEHLRAVTSRAGQHYQQDQESRSTRHESAVKLKP